MTHEESSWKTKKLLSDTLKELMAHKPFTKITVSELIRKCDVNRKTFYYHFDDIFGLLKWMLEQETIEVVKNFEFLIDYQDAFLFVINYVEENAYILNCLYNSIGRDELKRFLYMDFIGIVEKIIRTTEEKMETTISDDFRLFLCDFYTEGIAGMLINLFQQPDKYNKDQLHEYFGIIIHTSIPSVIETYTNQKKCKT